MHDDHEEMSAGNEQLADAALAGDPEAFGTLYTRHYPNVVAYVARRWGDVLSPEDLAQETFVAAFEALGSWNRVAPFRAWLFGIAHHKAQDELRRLRNHPEPQLEEHHAAPGLGAPSSCDCAASPEPDPADRCCDAVALRCVLGHFTPEQRAPLLLQAKGYATAEIAAALGVSPEAAAHREECGEGVAARRSLTPPRPVLQWAGTAGASGETPGRAASGW